MAGKTADKTIDKTTGKIERFYHLANNKGQERYAYEDEKGLRLVSGNIFSSWAIEDEYISLNDWFIIPPCRPSKIVCLGRNYSEHAREMSASIPEAPVLFIKPSNTVIGQGEEILWPHQWVKRLDYEGELGVIIGKACHNIPQNKINEYIFGYTCANDITARDLQPKDGQWTLAKSFNTFCPLGPAIVRGVNPQALDIRTYLNGELRQNSNTKNMLFSVYEAASYISRCMTLYPGDVILTGTPEGIGTMKNGDKIRVEIEYIGSLENSVKSIEL